MKKKKHSFVILPILFIFILCSCEKDYTKGTPFDKGNIENPVQTSVAPNNDSQPSALKDSNSSDTSNEKNQTDKSSDDNPSSPSGQISTDEITVNQSDNNSNYNDITPDNDLKESTDKTSEGSGDNNRSENISDNLEPSPIEASPTAASKPEEIKRDSFDRNEYWEKTFLIWLPMFNAGTFTGQNSAGTFDYAEFNNVSDNDVKNYISTLKNSGFNQISQEIYNDNSIAFSASNEQNWMVNISLTGNTLILGSGFMDVDFSGNDTDENLYNTTMLQYLPRFNKGEYVSSETRQDDTMFTSIIYSNVAKSDVLAYIEQVKVQGYIYAPDEGNEDDLLWYIALNEESFECHIEFSGSDLKIGCGYLDED